MAYSVLAQAVDLFFDILTLAIFIRVILSWIRPQGYNRWYIEADRLLYALTEPILAPIRNLLPMSGIGLDFSPFIAILLIRVAEQVLISILRSLLL